MSKYNSVIICSCQQVLHTLDQIKQEFNITSHDEPIISLLERYQRAYQLVNQLLQESLKGTNHQLHLPNKQHPSVKTTEDPTSDTDLFDSVTQLDEETGTIGKHHLILDSGVVYISKQILSMVSILKQKSCNVKYSKKKYRASF